MTLGEIRSAPDALHAVILAQLLTHTRGRLLDLTQSDTIFRDAQTDQTMVLRNGT